MPNIHMWNVFHDGEIVEILGDIPGDLSVNIQADYLREELPDTGGFFVLRITECDYISFSPAFSTQEFFGLSALRGQDLEILSAYLEQDDLCLLVTGGQIRFRYKSESIENKSGEPLSYAEVAAASDRTFPKK